MERQKPALIQIGLQQTDEQVLAAVEKHLQEAMILLMKSPMKNRPYDVIMRICGCAQTIKNMRQLETQLSQTKNIQQHENTSRTT